MNFIERLMRMESMLFAKENYCEIFFYENHQDLEKKIKRREKELGKKIDMPINIKIISKRQKVDS